MQVFGELLHQGQKAAHGLVEAAPGVKPRERALRPVQLQRLPRAAAGAKISFEVYLMSLMYLFEDLVLGLGKT